MREMDISRRRLMGGAAAGIAALAGGRAVYNVGLGYDRFTGTNVRRQDLDPLVADGLLPGDGRGTTVSGAQARVADRTLHVETPAGDATAVPLDGADRGSLAATDDAVDAGGALLDLHDDLVGIASGDVRYVYADYEAFLERLDGADVRPATVAALRSGRRGDPAVVETFTGASPTDLRGTIEGLVDGFRTHTSYDFERYVVGSIEDNVILGAADLRRHFESATGFEAMMDGEDSGLFCYELVFRSIEALQAAAPTRQTPPVIAGYVTNDRHKHAFTSLASVYRAAGQLIVPVTFVDYTRTTMHDDLRARWLLGEGLDAYTTRQRVTRIHWNW